ncbi:fructosamine kinase family protein [Maribacter sp. X9]|uniref:fructosamine kinase family protein n=1 Tax=Maribacter sp. X9 TaxID=3402159 RepID=UPI003AF37520
MNKQFLDHISYVLCVKINQVKPLSGGDISKVFLLETETERVVCKLHEGTDALKLFQSEKKGLEAIAKTKTIATPKVLHCEALETGAFLLMEYVETKRPEAADMELLGHHLAALHTNGTAKDFGWATDNFIGSLPQSNTTHSYWASFYTQERLLPQLHLAFKNQLLIDDEIPSKTKILDRCTHYVGDAQPALLHGDLWSGNFLISSAGVPFLIDPAVYYGHAEVDMAMTKLFGGFSRPFYNAYREHLSVPKNEDQLTDLYQLYYLLVHLNLFGTSYYAQVISLLNRLFK